MYHTSSPLNRLLCAVVAAATVVGCRSFDWRGQGYRDQNQPWTETSRPPADEGQLSGLDAKARDIERRLGVQ